jgi:hypothetical protein
MHLSRQESARSWGEGEAEEESCNQGNPVSAEEESDESSVATGQCLPGAWANVSYAASGLAVTGRDRRDFSVRALPLRARIDEAARLASLRGSRADGADVRRVFVARPVDVATG